MKKTHILVIITDGVSLRNFAYSTFYKKALEAGYHITFWNGTTFDISSLGYNSLKLKFMKIHPLTSVFKNARKHVELNCFVNRKNDYVYNSYKFSWNVKGFKNIIRTYLSKLLILFFNSEDGLRALRNKTNALESRTNYFKACTETLKELKPDIVYNTSQRSVFGIAPIEAAKALKIPTIGFIYSWDNVPKSTLEVVTDRYNVWSVHMKNELLDYHPFIKESQVTVTGTPQFDSHFIKKSTLSRTVFYKNYELNLEYKYFCFSGDDITTSPQDPLYLRDMAQAIRELQQNGYKIGLIFRRCPVDFSDRFDKVLQEYQDVIIPMEPLWQKFGGQWDKIFPTKLDGELLSNIAEHCVGVINLGSSMVFDFAAHNKPCAYMNYHYNSELNVCKGVHVYNYIHFRSMPSKNSVYWVNSNKECKNIILEAMENPDKHVESAKMWFKKINQYPFEIASDRILESISSYV